MKRTMIFCMAALLAANFACGGGKGPVDPPPPPPPPPPVVPTITPDPTNSIEWVVSSTQTMKYTVSPSTSTCTATHDNTEPIAGRDQNRTVIQSTTGSGVTVVVQNSIFKGKPNLSVAVTCVNGSSAATSTSFNYPLVSGKLVISGASVVKTATSMGVIYELTYTGSGFSAYNGDTQGSYWGTMCGFDGREVAGTGWVSGTKLLSGIGGGPDFNWTGTHTYRCVNPNPKGSEATGSFVVP